MSYTIVFANHKGGVTKTTSVANVGTALAELGKRVLLVDSDPQANLTESYHAEELPGLRLEDLLANPAADPSQAIIGAGETALAGGVHLIASSDALADVALSLPDQNRFELGLRDLIAQVAHAYDYVVVDTPPGLGVLSGLALLAADGVVVPARPSDLDVNAAAKIYDLVEEDIRPLNPSVQMLGVLITQTQRKWVLRRQTHEALEAHDMAQIPVEIPFSVRVGSAARNGAPTSITEPGGRIAVAYRELAQYLLDHADKPVEVAA